MANDLRYDLTRILPWCLGLLGLTVVMDLALAWNNFELIRYLSVFEGDAYDSETLNTWADWIDNSSIAIGFGYLGAFVATVIACGIWIYRASHNAGEMQPNEQRITPGWAVGWYFVPFMLLFKPFVAMRQTWNSSVNPTGDIDRGAPALLGWWWAAWLVSNIGGNLSYRMASANPSVEDMHNMALFDTALSVVSIVSTILFIQILRRVTEAQAETRIWEVYA